MKSWFLLGMGICISLFFSCAGQSVQKKKFNEAKHRELKHARDPVEKFTINLAYDLADLTEDYRKYGKMRGSVRCDIYFRPDLKPKHIKFSRNKTNYPGKVELIEKDIQDMNLQLPAYVKTINTGIDNIVRQTRAYRISYIFNFEKPVTKAFFNTIGTDYYVPEKGQEIPEEHK